MQRPSSHGNAVRSKNSDGVDSKSDEAVPPVPAIPKAFESPNQLSEEPFFESFEVQDTQKPIPTNPRDSKMAVSSNDDKFAKDSKVRRRFTLSSRTDQTKPAATRQNPNVARLPPLNLLPLSTHTTEKIAQLPQQTLGKHHGQMTPPQRQHANRSPTTPMTASRATFPTFEAHDQHPLPKPGQGKQSNQQPLLSTRANRSGASSSTTFFTPSPVFERARPLADRAMPTESSEALVNQIRHTTSQPGFASIGAVSTPDISQGSSREGRETTLKSDISTRQPDERTIPTPTRRKMSLGFRRSSSKASREIMGADGSPVISMNDSAKMPPPVIPAPKLWPEPAGRSARTGLENGNLSRPLEISRNASESAGLSTKLPRTGGVSAEPLSATPDRKSSYLSPMQRFLTSRNASTSEKSLLYPRKADYGDVAAEEEMRKLASRRKEFETAAKEVVELQKRASAKERMSPGQATRVANLNIFERGEVIDYSDVFFCGTKTAKKHTGDLESSHSNFGYDDERGDYNIVVGDHLAYRYEVVDLLGKGSFGQVVRCIDHKAGKLVAVKIIRNKKRFHQQALVEVNILQRLRDWV